jgi:gas vesicle protein
MSSDTEPTNEVTNGATSAILLLSAGALIGAAAALVFAPASGRDTRRYLGRRSRAMAGAVATEGKKVLSKHGERVAQAMRHSYAHAASVISGRPNGVESGQAI